MQSLIVGMLNAYLICFSGSAMGGLVASLIDLFVLDEIGSLIFQLVTAIVVLVVTVITFSLRETKGAPLPEYIETMPQVQRNNIINFRVGTWCTK